MNSKKRLKLLLTNDDGIRAQGLNVLADILCKTCDVYILAPEDNRSGVSSHIVMNESLMIKKYGENKYSCSGYPCDCVITAFNSSLFDNVKFDAVLSGINQGPNMGTDCIYSGTVAAARQAVLYGCPGIALSLKTTISEYADNGYKFDKFAEFVKDNIELILKLSARDCIININARVQDSYKGVKFTTLCIRNYKDKIELDKVDDDSYRTLFCSGNLKTTGSLENEYDAVNDGYISISRLHAEPVDFYDSNQSLVNFVL